MDHIPVDLALSNQLKYLSLENNHIYELHLDVCSLRELEVLHIEFEQISSIPKCIGDLPGIRAIWIDICPFLSAVPLAMFSLPTLVELSVYSGSIDMQSLIEFNVPDAIVNDTDAV